MSLAPDNGVEVFATRTANASAAPEPFIAQRLHVATTSFQQVHHLLRDYVSEGEVHVISIIEREGNVFGTSSALEGAVNLDQLACRGGTGEGGAVFLSCEDMRERKVEQRLGALLQHTHRAGDVAVIYKTAKTPTESATVAFIFSCGQAGTAHKRFARASGQFQIADLADCFIYVCLQYCLSPRQSDTFFGLAGELLTRAACQILAQKVSRDATGRGNEALYSLCCSVAAAQYEGRAGSGSFIFCSRQQGDAIASIKFRQPVHATHHVGARKLIEMASEHFALLFDGDYFWGFTSLSEVKRLPHVAFKGRGIWSIQSGDDLHCLVSYGVPVPRGRVLTEEMFKEHLLATFPTIDADGLDQIWQIATIAAEQPVGTNILFTPHAAREAARLASQCITINPVKMTADLTLQLTAIDGTVITDISGNVHALGAIMDGQSTPNGTWQRGGRYNSAANYVSSANFPALIFIVSQDGYVDIVPPIGQRGQKWKQRRYLKLSSTVI